MSSGAPAPSRTPPPTSDQPAPHTKTTPRAFRLNSHGSVQNPKVEAFRDDTIADMGEAVPQISWKQFKEACLPRVDEQHLDQLCSKLDADGTLKGKQWKGFDSRSNKDEERHYLPLVACFNTVLKESVVLRGGEAKQDIELKSRPNHALFSEASNASYKPDILAKLSNTRYVGGLSQDSTRTAEDHECDIFFMGELKKNITEDDIEENARKIIGNANHVLSHDPTRRFFFGMTIENTTVRFWFFSRSHIFVSSDLNLETNAKDIVYFLAALGKASDEERGFDPSVRRVWYNGHIQYQYAVGGKTYQTTRAVSLAKAWTMLGRASRVWEVAEVLSSQGKPIVLGNRVYYLKDEWLPEDSPTEKEILDDIFCKINQYRDLKLNPDDFYNYFVRIEACDRVQIRSTDDPATLAWDCTANFLRKWKLPDNHPHAFPLSRKTVVTGKVTGSYSGSMVEKPVGALPVPGPASRTRLQLKIYEPRVHCRTLSERFGMALYDIDNHKTILEAIVYVFPALEFMYSSGYIHRDISAGNLLVSSAHGNVVCKLIDLEYAKRIDDPNYHKEVKTGTPHFIASEVEEGQYLFIPENLMPRPPGGYRSMPTVAKRESPHAFFRHNCLHDIESLFWIFVYVLFSTFPTERPINSLDTRRIIFQQLFPHPNYGPQRFRFLSKDVTRSDYIKELPSEFRKAGEGLADVAGALAYRYTAMEAVPGFHKSNLYFDEDHKLFAEYFRAILPDVYDKSVQSLWPSTLAGEKRKRETDDDSSTVPRHGPSTQQDAVQPNMTASGSGSGQTAGSRFVDKMKPKARKTG
ncbi:hypothetical protein VNI00_008680 [Paramarasmius palmivorus]|uniref:Protein kinase domain-containing protein n=1 Tax=Paramarasmius palmivorus TaxID=297713 RepID=A0AAW0CWT5_9AGAR